MILYNFFTIVDPSVLGFGVLLNDGILELSKKNSQFGVGIILENDFCGSSVRLIKKDFVEFVILQHFTSKSVFEPKQGLDNLN